MEPNRRPYTTERPLSLKTMRAEPPSLYDGTSTFTQIAQHSARKCSSTCSLFVNTVAHTRTIANVPKQNKMFTALTRHTQQVECAQTTKRCKPARRKSGRAAHQHTTLVRASQCVSQHFAFVLHRSNSVQLKQSQTNSKCSRSSQRNAKHACAQQCNRAKTMQVFFTSNDALPTFFFNQSLVLFPRPRVAHTEWCRPVIYH